MSAEILVLRAGRVVEHNQAERVMPESRGAYTRALMAAAFDLETAARGGVAT